MTLTDTTGAYTLYSRTGGQVTSNNRDRARPPAINSCSQDILSFLQNSKINQVIIKTSVKNLELSQRNFAPKSQGIKRFLKKKGIEIISESVIVPAPSDRVRPKHGRRGRRI